MPGRDGRGPAGMGPMSGRGMGLCVGTAPVTGVNPRTGRAAGYGGGFGRGYSNRGARCLNGYGRSGMPVQTAAGEEREWLRAEERHLTRTLRDVRDRLSRFGGENDAQG